MYVKLLALGRELHDYILTFRIGDFRLVDVVTSVYVMGDKQEALVMCFRDISSEDWTVTANVILHPSLVRDPPCFLSFPSIHGGRVLSKDILHRLAWLLLSLWGNKRSF